MRWFNLKFFYVVGHLMLTGALCIPSLGRATEVFPEKLESLSSTQNTAVFSVSAEQWNAPCMEEQVSQEGRSSASCDVHGNTSVAGERSEGFRMPEATAHGTCPSVDGAGCRERQQEKLPRSGQTLVTLPGLLAVMQKVAQQPESGVALHYSEDERGEIWVEELRDWLVALGLPSNRIQLVPGSSSDVINISHVAIVQNPADGKDTLTPIITEPFQIKEVTDAVNGVEIP